MDQRPKDRKGLVPEPLLSVSSRAQPATLRPWTAPALCAGAGLRPGSSPTPSTLRRPPSCTGGAAGAQLPAHQPSPLLPASGLVGPAAWGALSLSCPGLCQAAAHPPRVVHSDRPPIFRNPPRPCFPSRTLDPPWFMLLFTFLIDGLLPLCPLQVVSSPRAGLSLPPQCLTHERGAAKFIEQTSETKCFSPPEGTPNEAEEKGTWARQASQSPTPPIPCLPGPWPTTVTSPLGRRTKTPGTLDRKHRLSASENRETGTPWGLHTPACHRVEVRLCFNSSSDDELPPSSSSGSEQGLLTWPEAHPAPDLLGLPLRVLGERCWQVLSTRAGMGDCPSRQWARPQLPGRQPR